MSQLEKDIKENVDAIICDAIAERLRELEENLKEEAHND